MTTKLKPQTTATEKSVRSATSCSQREGSVAEAGDGLALPPSVIPSAAFPRVSSGLVPLTSRWSAAFRASLGADAAVDRPGGARDPAGLVGGEEGDHGGDLLGVADTSQPVRLGLHRRVGLPAGRRARPPRPPLPSFAYSSATALRPRPRRSSQTTIPTTTITAITMPAMRPVFDPPLDVVALAGCTKR